MIWTLTYPKGQVEHKHFSLKCPEVPQCSFFDLLLNDLLIKRSVIERSVIKHQCI